MRKFALIVMLCACAAACGKKSTPAPAPLPPAYVDSPYVTVSISGVSLATSKPTAQTILYPGDSAKRDVQIMITQTTGNVGYALNLYITNYTGVNTYPVNPPLTSITYYVAGVRHYATSGQIVVATDSADVLTGTFSFVADTLSATNGVFNVQL